jgi:hypothetical protein
MLRGGGGMRFLSPLEAGKAVMVCLALWNFILAREGIQDEHDSDDNDYNTPVLGTELPMLPPLNLQNRIPTREHILNLYYK